MRRCTHPYPRHIISLLLVSVLIGRVESIQAQQAGCYVERVTITGYFTPLETDYAGDTVPLQTTSGTVRVKDDFLADFEIEWMGVTEDGTVIGKWDSNHDGQPEVHPNLAAPLDGLGDPLRPYDRSQPTVPGTAAANFLSPGTMVRIIEHPRQPLHTQPLYEVTDTIGGPSDPLHIDLYTGEGAAAKQATYGVTKLGGKGIICAWFPA